MAETRIDGPRGESRTGKAMAQSMSSAKSAAAAAGEPGQGFSSLLASLDGFVTAGLPQAAQQPAETSDAKLAPGEQDALLMQRLVKEQIPLTVCPLSNLKLCVIKDLADHNLPRLLAAGLKVMINSDDPAYFGGYVNENYTQLFAATGMGAPEAYQLARNSLEASFAGEAQKDEWIAKLDAIFAQFAA